MLEREREIMETVVRLAGQEIVRISKEGFKTSYKANEDPLTTADLAANRMLREAFKKAFPDDGWLSEESVDDANRLSCRRVWIVDPIDGTKEFVRGLPEYAISVALVENGVPVLGAVHNPATDELFVAVQGGGSTLNGKPIHVKLADDKPMTILGSRSEMRRGEFDAFADSMDVRPIGSIAYKLALIAAGRADATFSLTPKNEWDIAGGVLLVQEAGGFVVDKSRKPFVFNQKDTLVPGVIAVSEGARDRVIGAIVASLES